MTGLPRRLTVIAPHPDDETLGCGGLIVQKRAAGADIWIVFLTDGRTSHAERMDVDQLIARRRQEGVAAAAVLGVREHRVVFLDFVDGELAAHRAEATRRVAGLLRDVRPEQVFVTSRWDTTPDHVAAGEIMQTAAREVSPGIARYEYLVWFWAHWPWMGRRHLEDVGLARMLRLAWRRFALLARADLVRVPLEGARAVKWAALREHATQMEKCQGDANWPTLGEVWDGVFLDCAFGENELFVKR